MKYTLEWYWQHSDASEIKEVEEELARWVIKRKYRVLSLAELVEAILNGELDIEEVVTDG